MAQFDAPVDWRKLHAMPSGRLFWLMPGDVLVIPAGTYHYVYTVLKKLVVASDFCNAAGWRTRVDSFADWQRTDSVPLEEIFERGLLRVEEPRANKLLERADAGEAPSAALRAYLGEVLAWPRVESAAPVRGDRPVGPSARLVVSSAQAARTEPGAPLQQLA